MKKIATLLFSGMALIASSFGSVALAGEHSHGSIEVEHPWSRPTPPGTSMGVGYLVIKNVGDKDVTLVDASTPRAGHVSIHETRMKDGVMRMQPLNDGLKIPAGQGVELKPNSYHLMLEELSGRLKEGESIPLTLEFNGAEALDTALSVQPLDADRQSHEMDHSKHQMNH